MAAVHDALRHELAELDDIITETERVVQDESDSFGWELSLHSLRARREMLLAEIGRVQALVPLMVPTKSCRKVVVIRDAGTPIELSLETRSEGQVKQLRGRVIVLLDEDGRFEFRPKGQKEIVVGKVQPDTIRRAARHLNQDVLARFTVQATGAEERGGGEASWTLCDVKPSHRGGRRRRPRRAPTST
jgi:hypothetical protein